MYEYGAKIISAPLVISGDRYTDLLNSSLKRLQISADQTHRANAQRAVQAQTSLAPKDIPVFTSIEESARAFDEIMRAGKKYTPPPPPEGSLAAPYEPLSTTLRSTDHLPGRY